MKKINDGGPVFPVRVENNGDEPFAANGVEIAPGYFVQFRGATLRDYFAAQALPSCISVGVSTPLTQAQVADLAYEFADTMLAAREQTEE